MTGSSVRIKIDEEKTFYTQYTNKYIILAAIESIRSIVYNTTPESTEQQLQMPSTCTVPYCTFF